MSLRSLLRRRPSAALVVSFLALFVALGGAGWAALRIPPNSVGTTQLQNFSVGNMKLKSNSVGTRKIIPGSVGGPQVNPSQVQLRLTGVCNPGAIQSILVTGNVTCTPTLPSEFGSTATGISVGSTPDKPTQITSESLAGSQAGLTYLALGSVHVSAVDSAGAAQTVFVACTLARSGSAGTEADATLPLGGAYTSTGSATIPLVLPTTVTGSPQTVSIGCYETSTPATPAPQVTATAAVNAIQTAANN